jgi:hypothetical protein
MAGFDFFFLLQGRLLCICQTGATVEARFDSGLLLDSCACEALACTRECEGDVQAADRFGGSEPILCLCCC